MELFTFYQPTYHLCKRYRERMVDSVTNQLARKKIQAADDDEFACRVNYMLLFSIYGRPGSTWNTEVRYYFNWDIVIDIQSKTVVTMYLNDNRKVPSAKKFGDKKMKKTLFKFMFRQNTAA
ncbi:hypothetical protein ACK8P5_26120 (plasmid) [Paenibacillus sp. EC2-1]|uniref:hypothetical protein n=1 Tax=Paenibacillus sp. EC2-1 TaxID=3388665 RepID=UPI003BEEBB15